MMGVRFLRLHHLAASRCFVTACKPLKTIVLANTFAASKIKLAFAKNPVHTMGRFKTDRTLPESTGRPKGLPVSKHTSRNRANGKSDTPAIVPAAKPITSGKIEATVAPASLTTNVVLKMRKTDKSGATAFAIDGLKRSVYFNAGMFAGDKVPPTVTITLPAGFSFTSPESVVKPGVAAKLTPEERKAAAAAAAAARKAMTPAQRQAAKVERLKAELEAATKAAAKVGVPAAAAAAATTV